MGKQEIIEKYYNDAVNGLTEGILSDKDLWYIYVTNLPTHLQVVYTVVHFHNQVFNGGFHQYFFNSFGQFAFLTITNLKKITAHKAANMLERAVDEINTEGLSIEDFRHKVFNRKLERITAFEDELCDILDDLDKQYDSTAEEIEKLLVDYLHDSTN